MSFKVTDKMRSVITHDYTLLEVMSRFGIALGIGEKTVDEVCRMSGVDVTTFLNVVNYLDKGEISQSVVQTLHIPTLMQYLKNAHSYYLDFKFPHIRRKLIESVDCSVDNEIAFLILKFFDAFLEELRKHLEYENDEIFPYVEGLLNNKLQKNFNIRVFAQQHDNIDQKLAELKNIIITYYPTQANNYRLSSVLFDIFTQEKDLSQHNAIENNLFVPAVSMLEKEVTKSATKMMESKKPARDEELSKREIEVVKCVAKGMANKEIADTLCLSIHTVLTHRKNIARKLQIHSPAGITIYAIVNKLVELKDIKDFSEVQHIL